MSLLGVEERKGRKSRGKHGCDTPSFFSRSSLFLNLLQGYCISDHISCYTATHQTSL